MKKTIATKKLSLNIQTLRTLSGAALDLAVGGRNQGIVSTDTPSGCFACPPHHPHKPAPRPPFNPSLVGPCPGTIKG